MDFKKLVDKAKAAAAALEDPGAKGKAGAGHKAKPEGEMHPAKDAGDPSDTPRKGGPRTGAEASA